MTDFFRILESYFLIVPHIYRSRVNLNWIFDTHLADGNYIEATWS